MALAFPLTAPSSPGPRQFRPRPASVVGMTASPFTGEQQVQAHQGQWWEADFQLPPMKRASASAWVGLFTALNFREGTVLLAPEPHQPLGVATGAPLVNGASQTGRTLGTKGWSASVTGIVRAGDFFQLGSGGNTRLHMVVQDADSNGAGVAVLEIWPSLRFSPADNAPLTFASPNGIWRLKEPFDYTVDIATVYGLSVTLMEAL
jgi:hypothetical protein